MRVKQGASSGYPLETSASQAIDVNTNGLQEVKPIGGISLAIQWIAGLLLIGGAIGMIIYFLSPIFYLSNDTASQVTTNGFSSTMWTGSTISTQCPNGYSRAPSGACVNLLIDFNNCGSFGFVCPSNYTNCSNGVCIGAAPAPLVGGILITGLDGSSTADDTVATVYLPVFLTLYNYSMSRVFIASNGVLCLGSCSNNPGNGHLPSASFGGPTAFVYWTDLIINPNTGQSVSYKVTGTAPDRTTTFEFYAALFGQSSTHYRFQIIFYERLPNTVRYVYFQAPDRGASATIGVQASPRGPAISYSVNRTNSVTTNMIVTFNTNTGTYTG